MLKLQITNYKSLISNLQSQTGVTLLELMVSVSLFAITIMLASGMFSSVINSQRKAIASQDSQENIRYSFERISKEIRMARKDTAHSCISDGNIYWTSADRSELKFLNYRGQCVRYYLSGGRLMVDNAVAFPSGLPLTPAKLALSNLSFIVSDGSALAQGKVTLKIRIETVIKGSQTERLNLETTISSRFYE
jgi:prepilin-type N-terminal cleavage/methylation domain-containing protein